MWRLRCGLQFEGHANQKTSACKGRANEEGPPRRRRCGARKSPAAAALPGVALVDARRRRKLALCVAVQNAGQFMGAPGK
jgi:hypothetical protein